MKRNSLIVLLPLILIILYGCTSSLDNQDNGELNSKVMIEDKGIITDVIRFGDDKISGEIRKNKLTKTAIMKIKMSLNNSEEYLDVLNIWSTPFFVNALCGAVARYSFGATSYDDFSIYPELSVNMPQDALLEDYKLTEVHIDFEDFEDREKIAECDVNGPEWEDITFKAYRTYQNTLFGMQIGVYPTIPDALIQTQDMSKLKVGANKGNLAPAFNITGTDGQSISLSYINDDIDKPVVLYFMATWDPFSKTDLTAANNVYPNFEDSVDFVIVTIDPSDSSQMLEAYKLAGSHDFMKFALGNPKILTDYGVNATTTKFAIDRYGEILYRGSGAVDENTWEIIFEGLAES